MPKYDVTIPFIRMLAGPMDYTQGAMRNAIRSNYFPVNSEPMSQGTRCHQLATYVIFESPLNMLTYLLPVTDLFLEVYDDPEGIKKAAKLCADLLKEFLVQQKNLIGDALASPGHGFASSRVFTGLGLSNVFDLHGSLLCVESQGDKYASCNSL